MTATGYDDAPRILVRGPGGQLYYTGTDALAREADVEVVAVQHALACDGESGADQGREKGC